MKNGYNLNTTQVNFELSPEKNVHLWVLVESNDTVVLHDV